MSSPSMRRLSLVLLLSLVPVTALAPAPALAASNPDLGTHGKGVTIGQPSTGTLLSQQYASDYRLPTTSGSVRVLILGTGVEADVFPPALQARLHGTASELNDAVGYGTAAASAILQVVANAEITSKVVGGAYEGLTQLEQGLAYAEANASAFDVVLFAFHPGWLPDPVSWLMGQNLGPGNAWEMAIDAVLKHPIADTSGGAFIGIPRDASLRNLAYAHVKGKERKAIEMAIGRAESWKRLIDAITRIRDLGLAIVTPAGDFGMTDASGNLVATSTQMIPGLAAHPDVITVGAAYKSIDGIVRPSPISARGPSLGLAAKPDLLAPTNLTVLVPTNSQMGQTATLQPSTSTVNWADAGPDLESDHVGANVKKLLQGTSTVAASVVAATVARLSALSFPNASTSRAATDARCMRGLLWSRASTNRITGQFPWTQGAGVLPNIDAVPSPLPPIPLDPLTLEVGDGVTPAATKNIATCGQSPTGATMQVDSFLGPNSIGVAESKTYAHSGLASLSTSASSVTLAPSSTFSGTGAFQGGIYAGRVTLTGASGSGMFPAAFTRQRSLDLTAAWGLTTGERTEANTFLLTPGLPRNMPATGDAFKKLMQASLDPFQVVLQAKITDVLGKAVLRTVPPGFWRLHLLGDHRVLAIQPGGVGPSYDENMGVVPAGGAIEGFMMASQPPCALAAAAAGPFSPSCIDSAAMDAQYTGRNTRSDSVGICSYAGTLANGTGTEINVYCGQITLAVPSTVVTRQIDLVAPAETVKCGFSIPPGPDGVTIAKVVAAVQSGACPGQTTTSASGWVWGPGARVCAPTADSASETGTFVLTDGATAGLPVGTVSYDFILPSPNRDAQIGLSFAFHAQNAIIYALLQVGQDALTGDGPNGSMVVAGDPRLSLVAPEVEGSGRTGSIYFESGFISRGVQTGRVTLIVVPTSLVTPEDLLPEDGSQDNVVPDGGIAPAQVELCNIGLEIETFARKGWKEDLPPPPGVGTSAQHKIAISGNYGSHLNAITRTTPGNCQTRHKYDPASATFVALGQECEEITFGVHMPKNNRSAGSGLPRSVQHGSPAHFSGAYTPSGVPLCSAPDAGCAVSLLSGLYDADLGVTDFRCKGTDNVFGTTCNALSDVGRQFGYDGISANGRFTLNLPISDAAIRAGSGGAWVAMTPAPGDHAASITGGIADGRRYPTGTFYDHLDGLNAASSVIEAGILSFEASDRLVVTLQEPGGARRSIGLDLSCNLQGPDCPITVE